MLGHKRILFFKEEDKQSRIEEAITRLLITTCMNPGPLSSEWLNPTEVMSTHEENMKLLNQALKQCDVNEPTCTWNSYVDYTSGCCCRSSTDHVQSGGKNLDRSCMIHAKDKIAYWSTLANLPLSNVDDARNAKKRRVASETSPTNNPVCVTFKDVVTSMTQPSVVSCIARELRKLSEK